MLFFTVLLKLISKLTFTSFYQKINEQTKICSPRGTHSEPLIGVKLSKN